ncbi:hypothetical protein FIV42_14640 [Persicimonas caeni]|jgi:hypothetical protein|uniref:Uncharacterized protein n=1 Tax=Persicimonas caeni TaxID=2292766 RepID=A0A4Y6PUC5_PERCE|nr:hypothetical protein [Persicimonas caeni]QDG51931.1 hypothetical protein FIV42_14640 [Persicimonas caeni]QED33152.1 hypothetical protein FRD00_14635 [Persicimonas caeni]
MADKHEEHEGPIHQAGWVFYLTVAVCYAVLALVMFAKWSADSAEIADIVNVFAIQAGVLAAFIAVFGGTLYLANKLVGATSGD